MAGHGQLPPLLLASPIMMRHSTKNHANNLARRAFATSDGYLHKTKIPTYHFQPSLPRLPVPEVKDTCDRFLLSSKPFLTITEYQQAEEAVTDFVDNHAPSLQAELVATDKAAKSNYVSAPWYEMYLKDRRPLVVNSNPAVGWRADPQRTTQISRASSLLQAAAVTYRTLRDKQLEPDIFHTEPKKSQTGWWENVIPYVPSSISFYGAYAVGAYPLDMSQYDYLFQSTRLPGIEEDTLQTYTDSKHVCVMRGSKFYKVNILDDRGDLLNESSIYNSLNDILSNELDVETPPLGALTTMDRTEWAHARTHLVDVDPLNAESLASIDSSLFVLCLEHQSHETIEDLYRLNLHGNGRNRWFDKSFSIIVDTEGGAAVNFEHAWGDGVAVIRFFNEVYKESIGSKVLAASPDVSGGGDGDGGGEALEFVLDDATTATIRNAETAVDATLNSLDTHVALNDAVNSTWVKAHKIGPDGFLQMAFQLAHATMYDGQPGVTYESASTSAFKHGRTETIRSTTTLSQDMCDVFLNPSSTNQEKADALRAAAGNHGKLTRDGLMGKGWDRHLFALKDIALKRKGGEGEGGKGEEEGGALPALFQCEAYQKMGTIILSTSTLQSDALDGGGFGPVNPDCYAIPYGISEENCRFGVMSYDRNSKDFCQAIEQSVEAFKKVLEEERREQEDGGGGGTA